MSALRTITTIGYFKGDKLKDSPITLTDGEVEIETPDELKEPAC